MIATRASSEIHPPKGPIVDVDVHARVRARPRGGRLRPRADRLLLERPGRLHRRRRRARAHRAARRAARAPARVRRARRSPRASSPRSTSSPAGASRCTSSRAAATPTSGATATTSTTTTRYRRTDEYLDILRAGLDSRRAGRPRRASSTASRAPRRGAAAQQPHLPIYFGGSSDAAIAVAAKHADVYALWGEPLAAARAQIERVRAAAAATRPRAALQPLAARRSSGATEEEAWERAYRSLDQAQRNVAAASGSRPRRDRERRLAATARGGRARATSTTSGLFTAIAAATGARGNTTALVGTPEQVAESLLRLRRRRRHDAPDPRIRSARGCARVRRGRQARARGGRAARIPGMTPASGEIGAVTERGRWRA